MTSNREPTSRTFSPPLRSIPKTVGFPPSKPFWTCKTISCWPFKIPSAFRNRARVCLRLWACPRPACPRPICRSNSSRRPILSAEVNLSPAPQKGTPLLFLAPPNNATHYPHRRPNPLRRLLSSLPAPISITLTPTSISLPMERLEAKAVGLCPAPKISPPLLRTPLSDARPFLPHSRYLPRLKKSCHLSLLMEATWTFGNNNSSSSNRNLNKRVDLSHVRRKLGP